MNTEESKSPIDWNDDFNELMTVIVGTLVLVAIVTWFGVVYWFLNLISSFF